MIELFGKPVHPLLRAAFVACLAVLLVACQLGPSTPRPFVGIQSLSVSSPVLEAADTRTQLVVRLDVGRQAQAVPGTWTKADLSLSNASLLSSTATKSVTQSGGSSVTTAFSGLRPGSGYSLTVKLYNGTTLVAQGSNSSFTLAAGSNSVTVTLTLSGGTGYTLQSFAGALVPPSGRQATSWAMTPGSMAVDSSNRLYVADANTHQVLRLESDGTLTRIAGNGVVGYTGDGGQATAASLNDPQALAIDSSDNLYIADAQANAVRKVTPAGIITTVAGNGTIDSPADARAATSVSLHWPRGVALNAAGDMIISDAINHRICFVPKSSGTYFGKAMTAGYLYRVAGTGSEDTSTWSSAPNTTGTATSISFEYPGELAFDSTGGFYFLDTWWYMAFRVTSTGTLSRVAGSRPFGYSGDGGPATSASTLSTQGLCLDASGNLYLADAANYRIRKVSAGIITTVAGNGTQGFSGDGGSVLSAQLNYPRASVWDALGNMYIADAGNYRIRKVAAGGTISTVAGNGAQSYSGDGLAATQAQMNQPYCVTADASGTVYLTDTLSHRVRQVATGGTITTIAGTGVAGSSGDGGAATSATLDSPAGLAVDSAGNLYVGDVGTFRIRKFKPGGTISTFVGTGVNGLGADGTTAATCPISGVYAIAVDASDNVYFADGDNCLIRMVPKANGTFFGISMQAGKVYTIAGDQAQATAYNGDGDVATAAGLNWPSGLAVDAAGNLYISDTYNNAVRMVPKTTGTYFGQAMTANSIYTVASGFSNQQGLSVDASGNLYLADVYNNKILKVAAGTSTATTVVGTGTAGFSGDGGAAVSAELNTPFDVEVDASGNLLVADWGNNLIRKAVP